jgi:hypothetical protein
VEVRFEERADETERTVIHFKQNLAPKGQPLICHMLTSFGHEYEFGVNRDCNGPDKGHVFVVDILSTLSVSKRDAGGSSMCSALSPRARAIPMSLLKSIPVFFSHLRIFLRR